MNVLLKRTGTCLLSAAAGICAAALLGGVANPTADIAAVAKDGRSGPSAESVRERREGEATITPGRTAGATKAAVYSKAWDAIARRNLTPAERIELQKRLLEQWSMVDLEGAMEAALENSWEGELDKLLTAFGGAFTKNPIEAWRIIQSGNLGPGAAWFRWQWLDSVSKENPLLVLSYFHELPTGLQRTGLSQVMRKHPGNPEVISPVRRMLEDMPADAGTKALASDYFNIAPPAESPAELGARLAEATTEQEKIIAL